MMRERGLFPRTTVIHREQRHRRLLLLSYRDAASRIKAFAPNPGRNLALVYRLLF